LQSPLLEFVAADDFEDTPELVAVIRGSDGGRRMYGIGDKLPAAYAEHFQTQIYNERVVYPGASGTRPSSSLARTTTPRCSTTRSSRAGGATGHGPERSRVLCRALHRSCESNFAQSLAGETPRGDLTEGFLSSDRRAVLLSSRGCRHRLSALRKVAEMETKPTTSRTRES
jgi:hypothetical protein